MVSGQFDVCMLGGDYLETCDPKITAAFYTNAYIVQSHYYNTLLENFEHGLKMKLNKPKLVGPCYSQKYKHEHYIRLVNQDNVYNIDMYWIKLQLHDNWVGIIDPMIEQVESYSDIYNIPVNHQRMKAFINSDALLLRIKDTFSNNKRP